MQIMLTKPQVKLLADIALKSHYVAEYYPPAKALKRLGLIRHLKGGRAEITDAGLEVFRRTESNKAIG